MLSPHDFSPSMNQVVVEPEVKDGMSAHDMGSLSGKVRMLKVQEEAQQTGRNPNPNVPTLPKSQM